MTATGLHASLSILWIDSIAKPDTILFVRTNSNESRLSLQIIRKGTFDPQVREGNLEPFALTDTKTKTDFQFVLYHEVLALPKVSAFTIREDQSTIFSIYIVHDRDYYQAQTQVGEMLFKPSCCGVLEPFRVAEGHFSPHFRELI